MTMVTGAIGLTLFAVFMLYYAIRLNTAPLWIIIAACLTMAVADLIQNVRMEKRHRENGIHTGLR